MVSDVGTRLDKLKERYGHFMDFELMKEQDWWFRYDEEMKGEYKEWRPNDANQKYLIYGEPPDLFMDRMLELERFLSSRKESHIICVTSWGVISELTGMNPKNCDIVDNVTPEILRANLLDKNQYS